MDQFIAKKIMFIILIVSFSLFSVSLAGRSILIRDTVDDSEIGIVTTAKTFDGEEYNCVDIYKQPSLKHPALQDPQVKERVHKYLANALAKMPSNRTGEGCPIGTVPIPKIKRKLLKSNTTILAENDDDTLRSEFAGIVQEAQGNDLITGASAVINIYNPHVDDTSSTQWQESSASIILENGNNRLRVGWIVKGPLHGDYKTRLLVAWKVSDDERLDCIDDSVCRGFVYASNNIQLDARIEPVSIVGKQQYEVFFKVYKTKDGWEFAMGPTEDKAGIVGHFPGYLFTNDMKNFAKRVRFGGLVKSKANDVSTPAMGSGRFVDGAVGQTCYMRHVKVRFQDGRVVDPNPYVATSRCYLAGSNGHVGNDPYWQYRFMFGGPGGSNCHS